MTIAFWCVLVGVMLPYVWFGVANANSKGKRDNNLPRDFDHKAEGVAKRALGAHHNAFEALPGFAAAVVIAQLAHGNQNAIDMTAMLWVLFRLLHGIFYIGNKGGPRSGAWFAGFACVIALFVIAARGG